ncbi:hypothetical protein JW948_17750 [bacterium]|nr:hypothetical protein [bacterium]
MKRFMACFCAALLICASAKAGGSGWGMTLQTGTPGIGIELVKSVKPKMNVRLGGNFFSFSMDETNKEYDLKYDGNLKLQSFSILADWYGPPAGFFLSGGIFINKNRIEASGVSTKPYEVGTKTYTVEEIGELDVKVDFAIVSPYLGLGWGNAVRDNGSVGFFFNLGMLYHGAPDVHMSTSTDLAEPTTEQEADIEDDLKGMQIYPVLSLGMTISF